jgi:hypothetical protein
LVVCADHEAQLPKTTAAVAAPSARTEIATFLEFRLPMMVPFLCVVCLVLRAVVLLA